MRFRVASIQIAAQLQASPRCTAVWEFNRARRGSFEGGINRMFIHTTPKSCLTLHPTKRS